MKGQAARFQRYSRQEVLKMKLTEKQKTCPYCKGHKKFEVMDGYFVCQIVGNKLKFELGDIADPYEVEPFELPLGFCFACGSKLKGE